MCAMMTKLRMCAWSTSRSVESLAFKLGLLALVVSGCSAPAPPTPTSIPTLAPTAPPAVTAGRVETLNAAGAAYASGDLKTAASLYERVVNTPPASGDSPLLTDFADFRAAVALLANGDEDQAHAHVEALTKRDANGLFARLANQLWDQYGMVGQLRGACAQLQPQVASQAGSVLSMLQNIGVMTDAASLCSVPQGGAEMSGGGY